MAINDIVQTVAEVRVDARSLSEFVFKPAGFKVARRLAPTVDTLQFYINRFNSLNSDFSSSVSVALSSLNNSVAEAEGKVTYIETTVQDAIKQSILSSGFVTIDSFELGATITQHNQALRHAGTGKLYRWAGDLPKVVPVGSSPASTGGFSVNTWLEVSDTVLRQEIANGELVEDSFIKTTAKGAVGSVGRNQRDINNAKLSIRDFGATPVEEVPNFDSTAAFQLAFNAAIVLNQTLFIEDGGTYHISVAGVKSSLVGALNITESHNGLTVIGENHPTIKAVGNNDDFYSMIKIVDAKNIQFHGIDFDGNGAKYFESANTNQFENAYSAINIRANSDNAVDDILFYNCKFKNTGESAITSWGSSGVPYPHYYTRGFKAVMCQFENIGAHGIGMNEFSDFNVSMCTFKNVGMKRLVANVGSGLAVDASGGCRNGRVNLCTVDGAGGGFKSETHVHAGVDVPSSGIEFTQNSIKNLWQSGRMAGEDFSIYYGIRLNGVNSSASFNTIESYGTAIFIEGKAKGCVANNNTILSTAMPNSDAIYMINSAPNYGNNQANFNVIKNAKRYGINVQGFNNSIANNDVSNSGSHGIFVNYATNPIISINKSYNNNGNGIQVQKKTTGGLVTSNSCYDSRVLADKTQLVGIAVARVYDEASDIQVDNNNCYGNKINNYSMSANNTYSKTHLGYKVVYNATIPDGGLWNNGDRVVQSFVEVGRVKGWVCSKTGGAVKSTLVAGSSVVGGDWYQFTTGSTVWEVLVGGVLAADAPDITLKSVGDTINHGTATLVLRSLTTAAFISDGVY